ncbi:uncharacterized protein [Haliotis cracherodii]|uniref:uncharacterized protein n=1 Tax=Haliotis cracherodii TaxID=6455 RepID=UPI0039E7AEBA
MKVCWNILICMWIGVIHGAVHANGTFVLTSSPLTATDGELLTLICSIRDESTKNIGWLQNNKAKVVTQKTPNCIKHKLAYGHDIINRINVSCSTTAHSMTFRFHSTTDQGAAWQCGKQVSDNVIHPRSNNYTIDGFVLTSSPLTATEGELFTLICSFHDGSAANIGWWQNNKPEVVTQKDGNCIKRQLAYGQDIISRINVSCSTTAHSMTFRFNSTTDQGAAWQCGKQVSDTDIHPRSNNYTIGTEKHAHTSSPVMSTRSLSTTTRNMETASDPQKVTTENGTDGHDGTSSSVMSTQSLSTTTRNMKMTSDQETVTTKDAFTGEKDPNLLYIVFGAVGGAVLLAVVVVGLVFIGRRRKAALENDLYEGSRDVQPMNAAMNQEDDFMLSGNCMLACVSKCYKNQKIV